LIVAPRAAADAQAVRVLSSSVINLPPSAGDVSCMTHHYHLAPTPSLCLWRLPASLSRTDLPTTRHLIRHIPSAVRGSASTSQNLHDNGRYLSIDAGNHLLVRVPACSDSGRRRDAESFIIWPADSSPSILGPDERQDRIAFEFNRFAGHNFALSFSESGRFNSADWKEFAEACSEAMHPSTRSWPSNVSRT